ncbi:hypothetical protein VIGAN_09080700, partial [Vigna angularis var. angularis]
PKSFHYSVARLGCSVEPILLLSLVVFVVWVYERVGLTWEGFFLLIRMANLKDAHSFQTFHHFEAPLKVETTIDMGFEVFHRSFLCNHHLEAPLYPKTTIEDEKTQMDYDTIVGERRIQLSGG